MIVAPHKDMWVSVCITKDDAGAIFEFVLVGRFIGC